MRSHSSKLLALLLLTVLPLALTGCGPQPSEDEAPSAPETGLPSPGNGASNEDRAVSAIALPTFTLSLSSPALEIVRGTSKTTAVNVTRLNGFTGAVALSLDLNVGFSATFSPSTVSSLGTSSAMTITASPKLSPGTYNVTVRGVSGSMERTAVLQVTVPAPTFTLALKAQVGALPEPLVISQNRTGRFLVQLDAINGFTSPVSFSVLGLPTGVFEKREVTPGSNTTPVNLVVENFSVPGNTPITVRAEGGGQVKTASFTLQVEGNAIQLDTDSVGQGQLSLAFGSNSNGMAFSQRAALQTAMTLQPSDGSILAGAGSFLSRFSAAGALERTTERDTLPGNIDTGEVIYDVAVRDDGAIVTLGTIDNADPNGGGDFFVLNATRYTASGDLDTTYGVGGRFQLANAQGLSQLPIEWGKTLIAGTLNGSLLVLRLTPGGNLDPDFNGDGNIDGKVLITFGSTFVPAAPVDMARDSAGRIVVACVVNGKYTLVRLNANGALDTTFGQGGALVTNLSSASNAEPVQLALDAQDRIVLAGTTGGASSVSTTRDFIIARFLSGGAVDTTFGQGGSTLVDFVGTGDTAAALALQPDGKILVGGETQNIISSATDSTDDYALARLDSNGSLDASFGQGGKIIIGLHDSSQGLGGPRFLSQRITSLVLQPDGQILATGQAQKDATALTVVMRFNP